MSQRLPPSLHSICGFGAIVVTTYCEGRPPDWLCRRGRSRAGVVWACVCHCGKIRVQNPKGFSTESCIWVLMWWFEAADLLARQNHCDRGELHNLVCYSQSQLFGAVTVKAGVPLCMDASCCSRAYVSWGATGAGVCMAYDRFLVRLFPQYVSLGLFCMLSKS